MLQTYRSDKNWQLAYCGSQDQKVYELLMNACNNSFCSKDYSSQWFVAASASEVCLNFLAY